MKQISYLKLWLSCIGLIVVCFLLWRAMPAIDGMIPLTAKLLVGTVDVLIVLVPLSIIVFLLSHVHTKRVEAEVKILEASKLFVTERGFSQRVISTPNRRLLPTGEFHGSVVIEEVPNSYHYENELSEGAKAREMQDLRERQFAWKKEMDLKRLEPKQIPEFVQVPRPTQEALIAQLPYNEFTVSPGIHATTGEIVLVNLLEVPHIKFIGAPGFGKSCLAASILDQVSQTNDSDHLQLALLDCENKTSKLFVNNGNIARVNVGGRIVDLVASNADAVAIQLGFLKREMLRRAQLSQTDLDTQPVLIMYVEEMLSLQYEVDPKLLNQMIADILILAVRARKYYMFLLSCMQTDYSTEEMKVSQKMYRLRGAAAIDPTAARAAGFQNTDLVKQNFARGQKGQFVIEYPGFSNIVQVADYNVKRKLQQLERASSSVFSKNEDWSPGEPEEDDFEEDSETVIESELSYTMPELQPKIRKTQSSMQTGLTSPGERSDSKTDGRLKEYRLTDAEISVFVGAYRASGNIEDSLKASGHGSGYKPHARQIIDTFNLRKEEK